MVGTDTVVGVVAPDAVVVAGLGAAPPLLEVEVVVVAVEVALGTGVGVGLVVTVAVDVVLGGVAVLVWVTVATGGWLPQRRCASAVAVFAPLLSMVSNVELTPCS